jgi:hypothetical protein
LSVTLSNKKTLFAIMPAYRTSLPLYRTKSGQPGSVLNKSWKNVLLLRLAKDVEDLFAENKDEDDCGSIASEGLPHLLLTRKNKGPSFKRGYAAEDRHSRMGSMTPKGWGLREERVGRITMAKPKPRWNAA